MKISTAFSLFALGGVLVSAVQAASDNASNYSEFITGTNGGTGFLPWTITSNNNDSTLFAGSFLGSSTPGAGDINTGGQSFGLYGNPTGAFIDADRSFLTPLSVGSTFSIQLGLNFDNGNKGLTLFAGDQGEVFNFNVGNGSGGSVSSASAILVPDAGLAYDYGDEAIIAVTISITTLTEFTYSVSRISEIGNQGVLFSGSVMDLTSPVTAFRLYVAGTDGGGAPENNLFFNNLAVVPEPSAYAAMFGLAALGGVLLRRRARR